MSFDIYTGIFAIRDRNRLKIYSLRTRNGHFFVVNKPTRAKASIAPNTLRKFSTWNNKILIKQKKKAAMCFFSSSERPFFSVLRTGKEGLYSFVNFFFFLQGIQKDERKRE
ncbi:hypothetical protein PUN28_017228 [Cardiocondyla obscurior]|uniref:Ribosomal protein S19 n=1 Tax=Cardiocondyla obscurior TaxID=286306 RepID=A0AAW2EMZ1_9HYME